MTRLEIGDVSAMLFHVVFLVLWFLLAITSPSLPYFVFCVLFFVPHALAIRKFLRRRKELERAKRASGG